MDNVDNVVTNTLPQRQSLVDQTAAFLTERIQGGEWRTWLPSERSLCASLQVSRNTLRAALTQLKLQGQIRARHGRGNQILPKVRRKIGSQKPRDVALLTPTPIEWLRPLQNFWIDELRALLIERGIRLHIYHGARLFKANPGPALHELTSRNPHGCWVLVLATKPLQWWFSENAVPCVIAGTAFQNVDLPFCDLDYRAICRHAAGVLLGLGHRRIALIAQRARWGGDFESEAGFLETIQQSGHGNAQATVAYHQGTVTSIKYAVDRVLRLKPAITAMMVPHPYHYLTIASSFAQRGIRVPGQISLVSRDDDPSLSFVVPTPSRYVVNPHVMAKSLLRPVLQQLDRHEVRRRIWHIVPDFFRGGSIAPPPTVASH